MSGRSLAEAVDVIRRRRRKSALHHNPLAAAGVIVAGRAIDVVALAAALEVFARDGEGEFVRDDAIFFSGVEKFIEAELAGTTGRSLRPSSKNVVGWYGKYLGCSCISMRQPANNSASAARPIKFAARGSAPPAGEGRGSSPAVKPGNRWALAPEAALFRLAASVRDARLAP
jgi:hypothetical protein